MRFKTVLSLALVVTGLLAVPTAGAATTDQSGSCTGAPLTRLNDILHSEAAQARLDKFDTTTSEGIEAWKASELLAMPLCDGERIDTPGLISVAGTKTGVAKKVAADPKYWVKGELSDPVVYSKKIVKSKNGRNTPYPGDPDCSIYAGSVSFSGGTASGLSQNACLSVRSQLNLRSCLGRKPTGGVWALQASSCKPNTTQFLAVYNLKAESVASYAISCSSGYGYRTQASGQVVNGYVTSQTEEGSAYFGC